MGRILGELEVVEAAVVGALSGGVVKPALAPIDVYCEVRFSRGLEMARPAGPQVMPGCIHSAREVPQ
jgi:hypothetical protein